MVGGCARGFDPEANTTADIIYTDTDMQPLGAAASTGQASSSQGQQLQYFWEAFPAADGMLEQHKDGRGSWRSDARTTYMFTYMDAQVDTSSKTCLDTHLERCYA